MPYKDKNDPRSRKNSKIYMWKKMGLICREGETYDDIFNKVQNTTNCELCNILLTTGRGKTGRCMDHNHSTGYFRKVLCNHCNADYGKNHQQIKKPITNTSGHKNIVSYGNRWRFQRIIKKVLYQKYFDTLEEAIEYKLHFEKKITYSL
jgi:hypothetical protein